MEVHPWGIPEDARTNDTFNASDWVELDGVTRKIDLADGTFEFRKNSKAMTTDTPPAGETYLPYDYVLTASEESNRVARVDYKAWKSLLERAGKFEYVLLDDHPTQAEALEFMPLGGKYLLMVDAIATQWGLRMGDGIATQESSHVTDGSKDQAKIDFDIKTRVERTDRKNHNNGKWTETKKTKPVKPRPKKVK